MRASEPLVVEHLSVAFRNAAPVVRDVSFSVEPGEAFGLVGESGSGKSLTLRSILGLLPAGAGVRGAIRYGDRSLFDLSAREFQALRGSTVGMVFQDPMTALNPLLRVGDAVAQVVAAHEQVNRATARHRAIEMMERVGIRDAARRSRAYPHQFSGGMRQRVVIAMALAARPSLLLADEPTTALDVIVQAEILRVLDTLRRADRMSLVLVSHDLGVVAGVCDRVGVMYAGELVEIGPTRDVLFRPRHPYTVGLIASLPQAGDRRRLRPIAGMPPEAGALPAGCAFASRCALAIDACRAEPIPFVEVQPGRYSRCIRVDHVGELAAREAAASPAGGAADAGRPGDA
jgi:oligopeptide/dipeptide ABC transporter ATP-binding protein